MLRCLRFAAVLSVMVTTGVATADEAYYRVGLQDLEFTEGSLPVEGETYNWRYWQRADRMQPYAVLDGPGEVFVRSERVRPFGPSSTTAWDGDLLVRVPEARAVTGRIYLPKADLTGMVEARFKIPADKARADAKSDFYRAVQEHYRQLLGEDIPGGAWFRHQVRVAQKALHQKPGDVDTVPRQFGRARGRSGDLNETFELFTGGRAMSENLQLDRVLQPVGTPTEETVAIDSIEGITIAEIDWKELIKGKKPKLDPLASRVPADQHVIFFPTFTAALTMSDESKATGELIFQMAEPQSVDAQTVPRYQEQMCLTISGMARLLGPTVARSVALTGSDPYFPTGTDVAVLFEAPDADVLEQLVTAQVTMKASGKKEVRPTTGEIAGVAFHGFRSPDRAVCVYIAKIDGVVVVTNSPYQLQRLAAVAEGRAASIASLDEYVFFRDRYPLGDTEETAFLFLSDATIRRWCGPQWRIATSRRTRDAAVLSELQAEYLDRLARDEIQRGEVYTDLPLTDGGRLTLTPRGVQSSTLGTLEFMTPIAEMPLQRVTKSEAEAYQRWRRGYQQNWQWAFDPIAVRLGIAPKRLSADLSVMPLIWGSEYREFIRVSSGATLEPTDGDRHDALGHFILALNKDSQPVRSAGSFARMMAPGSPVDPLGWLGDYVEVYIDDDPVWEELAKVDEDKRSDFIQKNLWRAPIAVRADVSSGLKLTAFLAAFRAFIDQTGPGMTQWEALTYKEQPYVKITPTARATGNQEGLDKVAVYYTASGESLMVTLSERLLKESIDRQLVRDTAKAEGKEAPKARPWPGRNLAFDAQRKLIEVAGALGRREYQTAMQMRAWSNLPILNEWHRRYPDQDPVKLHQRFWQTKLVCPGGGEYVWNEKWQTVESTVYGHPGEPKEGPPAPPVIDMLTHGSFGLTFEQDGLRAKATLDR